VYLPRESIIGKTLVREAAANTVAGEPPVAVVALAGVVALVDGGAAVAELVELELLDPQPAASAATPIVPAVTAVRLSQLFLRTPASL
jgi:hypothetical protein